MPSGAQGWLPEDMRSIQLKDGETPSPQPGTSMPPKAEERGGQKILKDQVETVVHSHLVKQRGESHPFTELEKDKRDKGSRLQQCIIWTKIWHRKQRKVQLAFTGDWWHPLTSPVSGAEMAVTKPPHSSPTRHSLPPRRFCYEIPSKLQKQGRR